jgi:hypothetical protein
MVYQKVSTDQLILQFSTAAPDWRPWVPKFLQRPKMICLLGDKNWASSMIRRTNHSPFSHVDIVIPSSEMFEGGGLLGASDNLKASMITGNARGVAVRPTDYQKFRYIRRMVISTNRANDIRRIALSQLGKPFDNGALKDFLSDSFPGRRDWRLTDSWFCAELVVWAMEVGGFWDIPLEWPKNRVSPTDILLIMLMDPRWVNRETFWDAHQGER